MTRGKGRRAAEPPAELSLMAFGATWVAPWQLLAAVLDRLEADGVGVTRVDVDEDEAAAERHRIVSLPTLLVLRGGEERRRLLGAVSEDELRRHLRRSS